MDKEQFKKRISEVKIDTFPLDRILPLNTVYSLFLYEYSKLDDKNLFFKHRKYQRLREGYFALFVALSLEDLSLKDQHMIFPSSPDNDVYICNIDLQSMKPKADAVPFDVKEFTPFSSSFDKFIETSIKPKIDTYNLIIALEGETVDLRGLVSFLGGRSNKIWVTSAISEKDNQEKIMKVTVVSKDGIIYQNDINLDDRLRILEVPVVYQDIIRFRC